jgi:hypothetical protein
LSQIESQPHMVETGGEGDPAYLKNAFFSGKLGLTIMFRGFKSPWEKCCWSPGKSWEGCKTWPLWGVWGKVAHVNLDCLETLGNYFQSISEAVKHQEWPLGHQSSHNIQTLEDRGEGDLGHLDHLMFSGNSGSTIVFRGFNNLGNKS